MTISDSKNARVRGERMILQQEAPMKVIQFDRLGGPEVMEWREVPMPGLRPGMVIVKNRVIALNYGDVFFIKGQYLVKPVFPDIPGGEGARGGGGTGRDVSRP